MADLTDSIETHVTNVFLYVLFGTIVWAAAAVTIGLGSALGTLLLGGIVFEWTHANLVLLSLGLTGVGLLWARFSGMATPQT